MDYVLTANENSALFQALRSNDQDSYNPLTKVQYPNVVNQSKTQIEVQASGWGQTMSNWSGPNVMRFNISRIGVLTGFSLRVAFRIPGEEPTIAQRRDYGNRGKAKTSLTLGTITNNKDEDANNARGRLDRLYADQLLGINMIKEYSLMTKGKRLFTGTSEYLSSRFSEMSPQQQEALLLATTPKDMYNNGINHSFYAPGVAYQLNIPILTYIQESLTNAFDADFAETITLEVKFRAPSELFYYGNIGDFNFLPSQKASGKQGYLQTGSSGQLGQDSGFGPWDQSTTGGSGLHDGTAVTMQQANTSGACAAVGVNRFGTVNVGQNSADADSFVLPVDDVESQALRLRAMQHIQGLAAPWDSPGQITPGANGYVGDGTYWDTIGYVRSGPTFAYPNVDSNGESVQIQAVLDCDYLSQSESDARALRSKHYPVGSGLTQLLFDVEQEQYTDVFSSTNVSNTILDSSAGGTFVDPTQNIAGLSIGDSTRVFTVKLNTNKLVSRMYFMVRKMSDLGGDNNTNACITTTTYGKSITPANKILGAHRLYQRTLPIQGAQLLSSGRVLHSIDGSRLQNIMNPKLTGGTNTFMQFGSKTSSITAGHGYNDSRVNIRDYNVYQFLFGDHNSRVENTGCVSFQNLTNPELRIYFKPELWAEHQPHTNGGDSEARMAAGLGLEINIITEHWVVQTTNSGNGEIFTGMNT